MDLRNTLFIYIRLPNLNFSFLKNMVFLFQLLPNVLKIFLKLNLIVYCPNHFSLTERLNVVYSLRCHHSIKIRKVNRNSNFHPASSKKTVENQF